MKVDYGANAAPALGGVLETAVYVDDLDKAERFYGGVLGLPKAFAEPGRLLVFRSQESILLVFNPQWSIAPHPGPIQIRAQNRKLRRLPQL